MGDDITRMSHGCWGHAKFDVCNISISLRLARNANHVMGNRTLARRGWLRDQVAEARPLRKGIPVQMQISPALHRISSISVHSRWIARLNSEHVTESLLITFVLLLYVCIKWKGNMSPRRYVASVNVVHGPSCEQCIMLVWIPGNTNALLVMCMRGWNVKVLPGLCMVQFCQYRSMFTFWLACISYRYVDTNGLYLRFMNYNMCTSTLGT